MIYADYQAQSFGGKLLSIKLFNIPLDLWSFRFWSCKRMPLPLIVFEVNVTFGVVGSGQVDLATTSGRDDPA